MRFSQYLRLIKEQDDAPLKAPKYGEMQRIIYDHAIPYFLKAQSKQFPLTAADLNREARNDRFWTSTFDDAHSDIERLADVPTQRSLDDAGDTVGEAFDAVINKIQDFYSDRWNFEPGASAPNIVEPAPLEGQELTDLLYALVPGVKERIEAEEEHAGTVNAMHKDIMKIARQQKMTKLSKAAIAPWLDTTKSVVAKIVSKNALISSTSISHDKKTIFVVARIDDWGTPIKGAQFVTDITASNNLDGVDVKFNYDKTSVTYGLKFKEPIPRNIVDMVEDGLRRIEKTNGAK
jgi:hypothetical protein